MSQVPDFNFGSDAVARAYDEVIVPYLFHPWTSRLVAEHGPWDGRRVLDVATGTGIVAQFVGERVGPEGQVVGADINPQMLAAAQRRCADLIPAVELVESPAYPLDVGDELFDVVVCQQGLQFFPERGPAAREMHRVLRDGGKAVVSTWEPVSECRGVGIICDALEDIGEPDIGDTMRVPFDHMPQDELVAHFESAGFAGVELEQQTLDLILDGGPEKAVELAYATPIGPQLVALSKEQQGRFKRTLIERVAQQSNGATMMGRMVSNVLIAEKVT